LTYAFDPRGNLTSATDRSGTVDFGYDALDRVTAQTDVWGLTLALGYDAADRRTLVTDGKSGVTSYGYDDADRLTLVQFGGAGQTPLRADLGYNDRNELTTLTRYSNLLGTTLVAETA